MASLEKRLDAILYIMGLAEGVAGEVCSNDQCYERYREECLEALRDLGIGDDDVKQAIAYRKSYMRHWRKVRKNKR
ncbi:hypothetical protein HWB51_gp091 [Mycobacterium phage Cuke]|uniref:Uncharacterized protein n=1 Tax=Mycobacterium phage Cuke TaxID=2079417 RepID=A0A2L1IX08_9CAUD|nr:hypothetical protein HWB51_gp091 [Mycobacterium phage Cuke]AVD99721.1 hypothetical protein SEA_CUKE_105 [Mycobacterium phage Cuke]